MGFLFGLKLYFLLTLHHLHNISSVNTCMKNNLLPNHHLFRCDVHEIRLEMYLISPEAWP
jgi:hypothetical protein